MRCITILYPSKDNDDFNFDYYRDVHAPLIKEIMGDSMHKLELRRGTDVQTGVKPQFVATITIWVADWAKYEERVPPRQQEMIDQLPHFTKQMPQVQIDEVVVEL